MRTVIRCALQLFAGLGLFVFVERAWFLTWEYYFRWLPRPLEAEEFREKPTLALVAILFLVTQALSFLGMRFATKKMDSRFTR
jgi:hypothetical protein